MEHTEHSQADFPRGTTWQERLSGFAMSHFLISIFGFLVGMICLALNNAEFLEIAFCAGAGILLLLYVAAGVWMAREHDWSALDGAKDGFLSFLRPALIAWVWGGLLLLSAALRWLSGLSFVMIMLSVALASPSVLVVLVSAMVGIFDLDVPGYLLGLLLAGGLPPALFLLGSIWGSRRVAVPSYEEKEVPDGTEQRDSTA